MASHLIRWRTLPFFLRFYEQLKPWLDGGVLCAHNAGFDMKVLAQLLFAVPAGAAGCTVFLYGEVKP